MSPAWFETALERKIHELSRSNDQIADLNAARKNRNVLNGLKRLHAELSFKSTKNNKKILPDVQESSELPNAVYADVQV